MKMDLCEPRPIYPAPDTMKKFQNLVKLALEAVAYEDENLLALRAQMSRIAMEQWARHFREGGVCREHDRSGCRQCTRYAEGRGHPDEWL